MTAIERRLDRLEAATGMDGDTRLFVQVEYGEDTPEEERRRLVREAVQKLRPAAGVRVMVVETEIMNPPTPEDGA